MLHFNTNLQNVVCKNFLIGLFIYKNPGINLKMVKNDNLSKLTHQLCELRLEERRVCSDIRHLVARNATIDFAKAKQLNIMRSGVKKKIESIEAKIMPNIIA